MGLFTKHARLLTLLCQEPVDPCISFYLQKTSIKYRTNYTVLPRTSLYCTTVSQIQLSLSKFLRSGDFFSTSPYICRFHCDLSPSLIGWEFITYKFVCSAGFRRREKDFCGLYLEIFLSIISRRCFAYFAVDRLFTRLSSVCKGILFSLFSVFCLNWSY